MPTDLTQYYGPALTFLTAVIVAYFTLRGANRGAKASEKASIDDLTTELIQEYRTLKQELRNDMENRLANEQEERRRMQEAFNRRFNELLASSKYLETYVLWCVGGHKPPPQEVPHKALNDLKNLYPRE